MWEVSLQHYLSRVYNTHNIHISHLRVLSTLVARELEIHNYMLTSQYLGAVLEKIKGSSFVHGHGCYTPKVPPKLLSCEAEGDMHVKFVKQFTHYLILFQELESNISYRNFF